MEELYTVSDKWIRGKTSSQPYLVVTQILVIAVIVVAVAAVTGAIYVTRINGRSLYEILCVKEPRPRHLSGFNDELMMDQQVSRMKTDGQMDPEQKTSRLNQLDFHYF